MKHVPTTIDGETYLIPDAWIQGYISSPLGFTADDAAREWVRREQFAQSLRLEIISGIQRKGLSAQAADFDDGFTDQAHSSIGRGGGRRG